VSSLRELGESCGVADAALDQLHAVVADWQVLADLSFADLLMFCRDQTTDELVVVAQMRPYTAQTIYQEDQVGRRCSPDERPAVARAMKATEIVRDGDPDWSVGVPVREEATPIPFEDEVIAVVSREANLSMVRAPSQLELTYHQAANELFQMLCDGTFPFAEDRPERSLTPRVGDGLIRLDPNALVTFASPNAISAYRRLGVLDNIVGQHLANIDMDAEVLSEALADGEPADSEVEARGAVVLRRLIPLTRGHTVLGGLLLVREVTELRRHERLLLYKDATIREIHHRVKNNLQTVASLLRLQARRLGNPDASTALNESVRRISSIALVHETLSQDARQRVPFDRVAQRVADMLLAGLTNPDAPVHVRVAGSVGELDAEIATPLALVLSELIQNSLEHAYPGHEGGTVTVDLHRTSASLQMVVADDGVGLPDGWSMSDANLGLQIAGTLVETELGGTLSVEPSPSGPGTRAECLLPLENR